MVSMTPCRRPSCPHHPFLQDCKQRIKEGSFGEEEVGKIKTLARKISTDADCRCVLLTILLSLEASRRGGKSANNHFEGQALEILNKHRKVLGAPD